MSQEDTPPEGCKPDTIKRLEEVPVSEDIVEYTMACVLAMAPGTSAAILTAVERQVRKTFGGDEVFIAKGAAQLRKERDAQIKRDYMAGARVAQLMRRYKITRGRIYQIIRAGV